MGMNHFECSYVLYDKNGSFYSYSDETVYADKNTPKQCIVLNFIILSFKHKIHKE